MYGIKSSNSQSLLVSKLGLNKIILDDPKCENTKLTVFQISFFISNFCDFSGIKPYHLTFPIFPDVIFNGSFNAVTQNDCEFQKDRSWSLFQFKNFIMLYFQPSLIKILLKVLFWDQNKQPKHVSL